MIRDIRSKSLALWRSAILFGIALVLCARPIAAQAAISAMAAQLGAQGAIVLCIGGRIIVAPPADRGPITDATTSEATIAEAKVALEDCPVASGPHALPGAAPAPLAPSGRVARRLTRPRRHRRWRSLAAAYRSRAPPVRDPL